MLTGFRNNDLLRGKNFINLLPITRSLQEITQYTYICMCKGTQCGNNTLLLASDASTAVAAAHYIKHRMD